MMMNFDEFETDGLITMFDLGIGRRNNLCSRTLAVGMACPTDLQHTNNQTSI